MRRNAFVTTLAAAVIALASTASFAQGQRQGPPGNPPGGQQGAQQQQQQQQRQAERAMSQDRTMDQQRMQSRERDRTQDREQTQSREHAATGAGKGIYGGNLMTVEERNQYREQLRLLQSDQERTQFEARHREQMQLRAKERGIEPVTTSD